MRVPAWLVAALSVVAAVVAPGAPARAEEPASQADARAMVERCRGDAHREKMRVDWPAMEDETPPDGAEVVLVRG